MNVYETRKKAPGTALVAFKYARAGQRVRHAARAMQMLLRKAGFKPDQPRVPRGQPNSGRWTRVSDRGTPQPLGEKPKLILRPPGIGHNSGDPAPLEDPPEIPLENPIAPRLRHAIVRAVARWLLKALFRGALGPVGAVLLALEGAYWIWEFYPWIQAYLEAPKSLSDLQQAVRGRAPEGYEDHHIVEQTPAERAGFPRSQIDGPDNMVRISKLKHWEISRWYSTKNGNFNWQTPREYLRDKSWEERRRAGLDVLKDFGALKP